MSTPTGASPSDLPEKTAAGCGKSGFEKPLKIFAETMFVKISAAQTGGAFTLIENITPPNAGPPRHVHTLQDESFYVVSGHFLFVVGDERIEAGPGETLFAPRNIPHAFQNISSESGTLLMMITPGGMEGFFEKLDAKLATIVGPPNPAELKPLGDEYGIQMVGPPIGAH